MLHPMFLKPRRSRQCGQAIYLALAAIVFLSLMTFATWNISQAVHGKAQTLNAADAGAHMMATTVARNLNFMAYTNRAMVANHAVVGQLVSIGSLGKMMYEMAKDISYIEYVGDILCMFVVTAPIGSLLIDVGNAFEQIADIINNDVLPAIEYIMQLQNMLIGLLSNAQKGVGALSALDMLKAEEVIKANDPELEWNLTDDMGGLLATSGNVAALAETFYDGFTKQRDGDERFAQVVRDSRDGFTKKRKWMFNILHGGTDMGLNADGDKWIWLCVDGLQIRLRVNPAKPWKKETFRFYGNGAIAGSEDAENYRTFDHGELDSKSHKTAYSNRDKRYYDDYDGLQEYRELKEIGKAGENPSPTFVVLVYKPIDNNGTPSANKTFHTDDENNPFHLPEGRTRIYGIAAAQAFFRSPAQNDNDTTAGKLPNTLYPNGVYASLFSPYWQPRLTDLPPAIAVSALITAGK